ncbi:MAG: MBL fold metallo-hydrolase [Acholeplasmataceae bacterium]|nr:MBL fold metallo-hydrolase [Acholeplasmataceae bacterium]
MKNTVKITDNLHYVGVNNHFLPKFENLFPLPEGVSFNSFILLDEKTVLFDTVDASATTQFIDNVVSVLDGRPLDYLVIHHMEPDHGANVETIIKMYPDVKIVGAKYTFEFLEQFFSDAYRDNYHLIKDGDELVVGKNTLQFHAAFLVHWPEVFVTYIKEQKVLLSSDAFGSFGSIKGDPFSDVTPINLSEIRRYFANILAKFRRNVSTLLKKIEKLDIEILLPLHGLLHRDKETIDMLIEKYHVWAKFDVEEPGVIIAFVSMYGNTANAASLLATKLGLAGVKNIRLYDLNSVDFSYIIGDVYRFSNLVLLAPNYNVTLHLTAQHFLTELEYHGFTKRNYSLIANSTWGGRALPFMEETFAKFRDVKLVGEPFTILTKLKEDTTTNLDNLAKEIVKSLE